MSYYRIAHMFCRSLALFFFIAAGAECVTYTASYFLVSLAPPVGATLRSVSSLLYVVSALACGGFLSLFSHGISALIAGQSMLEGEAVRPLEVDTVKERSLIRAFTGLILISTALAQTGIILMNLYPLVTYGIPSSFFGSTGAVWTIYFVPFASTLLKAMIGFFFLLRANLNRMLG